MISKEDRKDYDNHYYCCHEEGKCYSSKVKKENNLAREKKLAKLYRTVSKMRNWADVNMWGFSEEREALLNKIYAMRMDCVEKDINDIGKEWANYSDQANLEWSSNYQRSLKL